MKQSIKNLISDGIQFHTQKKTQKLNLVEKNSSIKFRRDSNKTFFVLKINGKPDNDLIMFFIRNREKMG